MKNIKIIKIVLLSAIASMLMVACSGFDPKVLKEGFIAKGDLPEKEKKELEKFGNKPLKDLSPKEQEEVFDDLVAYLTSDNINYEEMGKLFCHVVGLGEEEKNECVEARQECLKEIKPDKEYKKHLKDNKEKAKPEFLEYAKKSDFYAKDFIVFFNIANKLAKRASELNCDTPMEEREKALEKFVADMKTEYKDVDDRAKAKPGKDLKSAVEEFLDTLVDAGE
ncbi:MAG TPA: hypothetical protein VEK06_04225 [Myxococcota bacterium]|nr:hypothetical protein [Myxococcota bacterium]